MKDRVNILLAWLAGGSLAILLSFPVSAQEAARSRIPAPAAHRATKGKPSVSAHGVPGDKAKAPAPERKSSASGQTVPVPGLNPNDPGFETTISTSQKEEQVFRDENLLQRQGLTGRWNGFRDRMEEHGVTIESVYTSESAHSFGGGIYNKKGTKYYDKLAFAIKLDTELARMWDGGTLFIYAIRNQGGNSTILFDNLQVASTILAPNQLLIHEAWYEQNFADGKVSLLAGLYGINSEFYVSDYASLFINTSFDFGPEIVVNVPTSIYPRIGFGARIRVEPTRGNYMLLGIFDGNPATRAISTKDGAMVIGEIGHYWDGGSYKAGYWKHTARKQFDGTVFNNDYGYYLSVDQRLIHFDHGGTIGLFAQGGYVPPARNEITGFFTVGLRFHGLIPTRHEDDFGIAFTSARTHRSPENLIEITYRVELTRWLSIQPSFQMIQNPGGDPTYATNRVGFLRLQVTL